MKTSRQNHLKVSIITFLMSVIQVNGASLTITQHPQYAIVSTSASLTCNIPSFTGGAEWLKNGSRLTQCLPSSCIPPSSTRYQYSANATTITVTIPSVDIALDNTTWACLHDSGADTGNFSFTVYKLPSTLYINGIDSSILYEGDTVKLSVSTGCIHPSGSAYYTVIWKYVEATSAAENNFGTIITQNTTSIRGCQNTYEDNLMFNLFLTNDMNTGNTTISISQVKMTFTMAEISFNATKNVAYNVTSNGTAAPTTTPKSATTTSTTTNTTTTITTEKTGTQTVPTKTTSTTTPFPIIPVGIGIGGAVLILLIIIIITCCCCRCCYCYNCRKDETKEKNGTEFETTIYKQDAKL